MKLKNLNALITGGSQGLGKTIAEHFLREGANVVLCARSEKDLSATRDELAAKFPAQKVSAKTCDVANETQVNELVAFALRELGSLRCARVERRHLRADGADGIRFARRMAAGAGHQFIRRVAAEPRGDSAFQKGRARQDRRSSAAAARRIPCRTSAPTRPRKRPLCA